MRSPGGHSSPGVVTLCKCVEEDNEFLNGHVWQAGSVSETGCKWPPGSNLVKPDRVCNELHSGGIYLNLGLCFIACLSQSEELKDFINGVLSPAAETVLGLSPLRSHGTVCLRGY